MKLGTIKIEALKLMFANNDDELTIDNSDNEGASGTAPVDLTEMESNPQYRDYLNNMNGSINRCFSVLESSKVLPTKRVVLISDSETTEYGKEVDLSSIEDMDDICRVSLRNDYGYDPTVDFHTEGDTLILPLVRTGDTVSLIYYPTLARLTQTADNTQELDIPNKIATIIPYYIKYDLFREDDVSESNAALRMFEDSLSLIHRRTETYQGSTDHIIGVWEE